MFGYAVRSGLFFGNRSLRRLLKGSHSILMLGPNRLRRWRLERLRRPRKAQSSGAPIKQSHILSRFSHAKSTQKIA